MLKVADDDPDFDGDLVLREGVSTTSELAAVIEAKDERADIPKLVRAAEMELEETYGVEPKVYGRLDSNLTMLRHFCLDDGFDYEMKAYVALEPDTLDILIGIKCVG